MSNCELVDATLHSLKKKKKKKVKQFIWAKHLLCENNNKHLFIQKS